MKVFYNISIFFIGLAVRIMSLFNSKAKEFVNGRRQIFTKIAAALQHNTRPVIWVHCASLGEFEQGRPVIEAMKVELPGHRIFLTFFSPSGYRVRKHYPNADYVFYLPLDTPSNARNFVNLVNPALVIFVKYEFWYHYSEMLQKRNIPLISISSIFRKEQYFFRKTGSFSRRILKNITHFFVQNETSVDLLHSINLYNVTLSGDTRFDRVSHVVKLKENIAIVDKFKADDKVMIVGSAWPEDLDVLLPFVNEGKLKFIIAPHEIDTGQIQQFRDLLVVKSILYSEAIERDPSECNVLIVDNVGMLSRLYRYGEFAFVGGAFGKGLHNILEPAAYGIPVLFGNKAYGKFQEAIDLINRGGAFAVEDFTDLKRTYEMLNVPETFLLACEVCRQYVEDNLGATERIMDYCRQVLTEAPSNAS